MAAAINTQAQCSRCFGMAFVTWSRKNGWMVRCIEERGACGVSRVHPFSRVVEAKGEAFRLMARRNLWVFRMSEVPREKVRCDNPFGLGNSPYNRCSFAIGIIDQHLARLGAL